MEEGDLNPSLMCFSLNVTYTRRKLELSKHYFVSLPVASGHEKSLTGLKLKNELKSITSIPGESLMCSFHCKDSSLVQPTYYFNLKLKQVKLILELLAWLRFKLSCCL